MQTTPQVMTAGQTLRIFEPGRYFRLMNASNDVSIVFYKHGAQVGIAESVKAGFAWGDPQSDPLFDAFAITSATAQTVAFAVSTQPVSYDRGAASVDVVSLPAAGAAYSEIIPTIVPLSQDFLAANPARRLLIVQNNDASGTIWLNTSGGAAVANSGLKVPPGGALVLDVVPPTGKIAAISDSVISAGFAVFIQA